MAEEQDNERTESATPFKREEARRRAQVAKSFDTISLFMLGAALAGATFWGMASVMEETRLFRRLIGDAHRVSFEPTYLMRWLESVFLAAASPFVPFFLLLIGVAIFSNLVQTGPVFSTHPLKPDLQRLNPAQGFKRIYSSKALFEAAKSIIKLGLFATVAYAAIVELLPSIMALTGTDPVDYPALLLSDARGLAFKLILALSIIAVLDLAYVRWDFAKKLRMSRREQKEEVKRREGDPQVRNKRRELQREAAKRSQSVQRIPDADVLITNPTHLAIALAYERGQSLAPRCLAKGSGEIASKMKELAHRHGVRVVEQRSLARALFGEVDVGGFVPEALYEPVARVYAELITTPRFDSVVEVRK